MLMACFTRNGSNDVKNRRIRAFAIYDAEGLRAVVLSGFVLVFKTINKERPFLCPLQIT